MARASKTFDNYRPKISPHRLVERVAAINKGDMKTPARTPAGRLAPPRGPVADLIRALAVVQRPTFRN